MAEARGKARDPGRGLGLVKGLAVTLKHLFKHNTVIQYPDVSQELPPRTRGVIALKEENCTVCMLCARECPDWCIYIDSHKETLPPRREGGRARKRNQLDRFAIDYSLCMYCGICVEVCPYDALFWSPEFEFAEFDITELTHEKEKLSDWMATVPPPTPLASGAELPGEAKAAERAREPRVAAAAAGAGPRAASPPFPVSDQPPAASPSAPAAEVAAAEPSGQAEDPDAVFERVLAEETAKGSSERVATGRAKAARMRVLKGISSPKPREEPTAQPPAPQASEAPGPEPSAAVAPPPPPPGSPRSATGYPQPPALRDLVANITIPSRVGEPAPLQVTEDPDSVYRQVLEGELSGGASPAVAEARARVARQKAASGIPREEAGPVVEPSTGEDPDGGSST